MKHLVFLKVQNLGVNASGKEHISTRTLLTLVLNGKGSLNFLHIGSNYVNPWHAGYFWGTYWSPFDCISKLTFF